MCNVCMCVYLCITVCSCEWSPSFDVGLFVRSGGRHANTLCGGMKCYRHRAADGNDTLARAHAGVACGSISER